MLSSHPAIAPAVEPLRVNFALTAGPDPTADKAASSRKWKFIKRLPLAQQLAYVRSADAQRSMDARTRREREKSIRREIDRLIRSVPSDSWAVAIVEAGLKLPARDVGRKHDVRLKLARECTRIGEGGTPTRRWMPPQCVALEDFLDSMDATRAAFYDFPVSPSARAIMGIELRRARESRTRLHFGRHK